MVPPDMDAQILIPTESLTAVNADYIIVCVFIIHVFQKSTEEPEHFRWTVRACHVVFDQPVRLQTRSNRFIVIRFVFSYQMID